MTADSDELVLGVRVEPADSDDHDPDSVDVDFRVWAEREGERRTAAAGLAVHSFPRNPDHDGVPVVIDLKHVARTHAIEWQAEAIEGQPSPWLNLFLDGLPRGFSSARFVTEVSPEVAGMEGVA